MANTPSFVFSGAKLSKAAAEEYSSSSGDESSNDDDYRIPDAHPDATGDIDDAFRFSRRKRKRKYNKETGRERAALGIFASDSEDDGPRKRWKDKSLRSKGGLSFVSKGAEEPTDLETREEPSNNEEQSIRKDQADVNEYDNNDTPAPQPSFGLGLGFVPSSATQPKLREDITDESAPQKKSMGPSAFSKKGKLSFAQRQMMKMGWKQGEGLGKESQGRNSAIEANLRPMGLGLGAVKEKSEQEKKEEKRQAALRGEVIVDSDEERKKGRKKKTKKLISTGSGGLDSGASTPRLQKPKIMTQAEIERNGMKVPDVFLQVLDMTGREQRMLTSGSGLMTPTGGDGPILDAEDIEKRKIIERARSELMMFHQEHENLEMRKRFLDLRIVDDQKNFEDVQAKLLSFQAFQNVADELASVVMDSSKPPAFKWKEVTGKLMTITNLPHQEDLAEFSISVLSTIMREYAKSWNALDEPTRFIDELEPLRDVIGILYSGPIATSRYNNGGPGTENNSLHRPRKSTTPYETMISQVWYPKVLSVLAQWDARRPGPILKLFQAWDKLLPQFVRAQLLEQIIRKLDDAVRTWKPRKHRHQDLPHHWLFGWLPFLPVEHLDPGNRSGLISDVKRKWRSVIEHWNFRDGLIPGLRDWKPVLNPTRTSTINAQLSLYSDGWTPLIHNHLLPRMGRHIHRNLIIEPSNQRHSLYYIADILKWEEVLPLSIIGEIFASYLFPKYHNTLHKWLISGGDQGPNYAELADWLKWWHTEVFSPDILTLPSIRSELEKGLTMVKQALELGPELTKYYLPKPGEVAQETKEATKEKTPPRAEPMFESSLFEAKKEPTFRDTLEDYCLENDYQFIPLRIVSVDGHPMFRITARNDGKGGMTGWFANGTFLAQVPGFTGLQVIDENVYSTALHAFLADE